MGCFDMIHPDMFIHIRVEQLAIGFSPAPNIYETASTIKRGETAQLFIVNVIDQEVLNFFRHLKNTPFIPGVHCLENS